MIEKQNRVGQQLGNYRLERLLGRGGFAEVYLGSHVRLQRQSAIKVLHAYLSEKEVEDFQREAQIIAALDHPNIVRILDFDVQQGIPFLVMDYLPNGTLRQRHERGERLPLATVVSYVKQIADALQYAHDQRLVHRDIKPENMLVGRRQEVVLSDFGIAAIAHSTASMTVQASAGTIPYMAPEQIQAQARPASDQYALGIVAYEWLCGERPFEGSNTEIFAKHLMTPPPPLRQKLPELPAAVEQVILKALAKDAQQRFNHVQAFATALENASKTTQGSAFAKTVYAPPPPPADLKKTVYAPTPPPPPPINSGPSSTNDLLTPQDSRKIAFRYGRVAGLISGAIYGSTALFLFHGLDILLLALIIYFPLGMKASRKTGKLSTAMLSILWTLPWSLLIFVAFLVLAIIINGGHLFISPFFLIGPVIFLIPGFLFGALGGAIGKLINKRARAQ
jgi:serine/threonine protein kinase